MRQSPVTVKGKSPNAAELAKFPLYDRYERGADGKLILPTDTNVMLSDKIVYAAMKELMQNERNEFRGVWDGNGKPCASRVPQDPVPKVNFHGVSCAPVWKRYYAFVRLQVAAAYGIKVATKADERLKKEPSVFTIGPAVLGPKFAVDPGDETSATP